jgi:hypothetical protein
MTRAVTFSLPVINRLTQSESAIIRQLPGRRNENIQEHNASIGTVSQNTRQ